MSDRQTGTVKWFNNAKGFGFITMADRPDEQIRGLGKFWIRGDDAHLKFLHLILRNQTRQLTILRKNTSSRQVDCAETVRPQHLIKQD